VIGLLECPSLQCIELHSNNIDEPAIIEEVFLKMPVLKVIYLHNNEVTKKIQNYRKTVIAKLPGLTYLDDRPVFADDRRNAEAFHRGGWDAERAERDVIKKEKDAEREKYHSNFKAMMDKAKAERKEEIARLKAEKAAAEGADVEQEEVPEVLNASEDEADCPPELEQVDVEAMREEQVKEKEKLEWQDRVKKQ